MLSRTLLRPTSSSGPSFHSPLFCPLQELIDGQGEDSSSESTCDAEQGSVVHPFRSPSVGLNASSDGDNESGGVAWGGDGEGSVDGYVAGDEASSPSQCVWVQELPVGGEKGEGDAEAVWEQSGLLSCPSSLQGGLL